jgi:hypothetical protein
MALQRIRWASVAGILASAGALLVIVASDQEVELFGPLAVTMAGIYLMTYALGPHRTVWIALAVLSTVVALLQMLDALDALPVDPAVGMSIVVVLLWLWTVARRRFTERGTFSVQTAGMAGFGAVTLVCGALAPRWGIVLIGAGFLAHGVWDAYHFRARKVVQRAYAELCGVFDVLVGTALIVAATLS